MLPPPRRRFPVRDAGQTSAEYAIALGVITVGAVAVFAALGGEIVALLEALGDVLPG